MMTGTYRVTFRLSDTGHYSRFESSKIVTARSRQDAVRSVPGGIDAEVYTWGPDDPEVLGGRYVAGSGRGIH